MWDQHNLMWDRHNLVCGSELAMMKLIQISSYFQVENQIFHHKFHVLSWTKLPPSSPHFLQNKKLMDDELSTLLI